MRPGSRRPRAAARRLVTRRTSRRPRAASRLSGARGTPGRAGEQGQAAVELVVLAPLLLAIVLAAAQLLAAGAAAELADHAAEAGAVALLQGEDPKAAARDAVPRWSRRRMDVRVQGRSVRVRMRPPSPVSGLADMLEVARRADAGPRP